MKNEQETINTVFSKYPEGAKKTGEDRTATNKILRVFFSSFRVSPPVWHQEKQVNNVENI